MYSFVSNEQVRYMVRVYIDKDQLEATLTVSAFALIGPATCYRGACAQAESVHENHVLERCSNECVLILSHLPFFSFHFFCRLCLTCGKI